MGGPMCIWNVSPLRHKNLVFFQLAENRKECSKCVICSHFCFSTYVKVMSSSLTNCDSCKHIFSANA